MKMFRNFLLGLIVAIGIIGSIGLSNNFGKGFYLAGDVIGPQSVDPILNKVFYMKNCIDVV